MNKYLAIIMFSLVFSLCFQCNHIENNNVDRSDKVANICIPIKDTLFCTEMQFDLIEDRDVLNLNSFGFLDDPYGGIYPSAIALGEKHLYITDPCRALLKSINLESKEVCSSIDLSYHRRIYDMIIKNNHIYCTTIGGEILLFNKNLELLKYIETPNGYCYFLKSENDQITIGSPSRRKFIFDYELILQNETREDKLSHQRINSNFYKNFDIAKPHIIPAKVGSFVLKNAMYHMPLFDENNIYIRDSSLAFFEFDTVENIVTIKVCMLF